MKRFFSLIVTLVLALGGFTPSTSRAAVASGSLIKASTPAVYYMTGGKRYVFPNEKVFFSWYADFSTVQSVSDEELASYMIGGNVTYKPGSRMVKIQSDPRVYAVAAGGRLRWVAGEEAARALFGDDWNRRIDDVSDAFFFNYQSGDPVYGAGDYDLAIERSIPSINADIEARTAEMTAGETVTAVKFGTWSDPSVWGGTSPKAGSRVVIPANVRVILDIEEPPTLRSIEIGGTLEFWNERPHALSARGIDILPTGTMRIGTEDEPWPADRTVTIRLIGASHVAEIGDGMTVQGTLDIHGAPATSWTRLASGTEAGSQTVLLDTQTGWTAGSEIAIASTSSDVSETEVATIASVDGGTLRLAEPLAHARLTEEGVRGEAGLLTRNVSIVGTGLGQGSGITVKGPGKARLSSVVLSGLGRTGVAGYAPLTFDAVQNGKESILNGLVIRDSGNRCISVRQTADLSIVNLVAYGNVGHCVSTHDGTETGLVLRDNLILDIRKGPASTGDDAPAGFYLRHPGAVIENNVVAGSAGHAYWYDLADEVVRLNGLKLRPREADLGAFRNNVARGAAADGLRVDDAGDGKTNYAPANRAVWSGYRGEWNGGRGFWMRGSNLEVTEATLVGNRIGGAFAAFGATLKNSVVIGNPASAAETASARVGFLFTDGPTSVSDTVFRNFVPGEGIRAAALGFLDGNQKTVDPLSAFRGLTLVNARMWDAKVPENAAGRMSAVRDVDAGTSIALVSDYLDKDCEQLDGNVLACPGVYSQLLVGIRDIDASAVAFERLDSGAAVTVPRGLAFDGTYAYATVIEGEGYRFNAIGTRNVSFDYYGMTKPLTLRLKTSAEPTVKEGLDAWPKVDLSELAPGRWAYDAAAGEAVLMLEPLGSVAVTW